MKVALRLSIFSLLAACTTLRAQDTVTNLPAANVPASDAPMATAPANTDVPITHAPASEPAPMTTAPAPEPSPTSPPFVDVPTTNAPAHKPPKKAKKTQPTTIAPASVPPATNAPAVNAPASKLPPNAAASADMQIFERMCPYLTPPEQAQFEKALNTVLDRNHGLAEDGTALMRRADMAGNGSVREMEDYRQARAAYEVRLRRAMVAVDPGVGPIFDKIDARVPRPPPRGAVDNLFNN